MNGFLIELLKKQSPQQILAITDKVLNGSGGYYETPAVLEAPKGILVATFRTTNNHSDTADFSLRVQYLAQKTDAVFSFAEVYTPEHGDGNTFFYCTIEVKSLYFKLRLINNSEANETIRYFNVLAK